jgi:hypothetical protein
LQLFKSCDHDALRKRAIKIVFVFHPSKGINVKTQVIFGILLLLAMTTCCSRPANAYDGWYAGPGIGVPYGGYGGGYGIYGPGGYGGYGGYGPGGYGVYGGGAGGIGGIASGMGNLVRAQGQRNVDNSQAEINLQQANVEHEKARSDYIDNQKKLHDAKLEWKRRTDEQSAKDQEAQKAARLRAQKFNDEHRSPQLSTSQLDPSTGHINWPMALKAPDFDELRKSVETLFQSRSKTGLTSDLSLELDATIGRLKDSFRGHIMQIPLKEYSQSRKFLDSLAVSVQ